MSVDFDYYYKVEWLMSPGYLLVEVPDSVRKEVIKTLDNLNEKEAEDYRPTLAGHLEKEFKINPGSHFTEFIERLVQTYEEDFNIPNSFSLVQNGSTFNSKYVLENTWVNYGKKYDFNPIHTHSGIYSFVLWVQIPYDIEEESKRYDPNGNQTGCFNLHYLTGLGEVATIHLPVDKSWEWRLAFFPSKMNHSVNPFYTKDDYRISISGNVKIAFKNE